MITGDQSETTVHVAQQNIVCNLANRTLTTVNRDKNIVWFTIKEYVYPILSSLFRTDFKRWSVFLYQTFCNVYDSIVRVVANVLS